jgi:hypothetical protein
MRVQVAPPLVVATIAPPRPTAQPWLASTKVMPYSAFQASGTSAFCSFQVVPPLVVARIVPEASAAQP